MNFRFSKNLMLIVRGFSIKYFIYFLTMLALASCGGGGSNSDTPLVASNAVTGVVVDGYIEGATVCIDLNSNQVCDVGEPYSITDAQGSYTLNAAGYDLSLYHIVSIANADTAKDADDGGLTLAQAGKTTLKLLAPANMAEVISPVTTLVVGKMTESSMSVSDATAAVAMLLNVSPEHVFIDPIASQNTQLHQQFQTIASLLRGANLSNTLVYIMQYGVVAVSGTGAATDGSVSISSKTSKDTSTAPHGGITVSIN